MSKINLITAPDILYNSAKSFLLICPSKEVKEQFSNLLANLEFTINVYLFEEIDSDEDEGLNYNWLFNCAKNADYIIVDIDNLDAMTKNLCSYFLSLPETFYLTKDELTPYNKININRVYNLDWLHEHMIKDKNEENA